MLCLYLCWETPVRHKLRCNGDVLASVTDSVLYIRWMRALSKQSIRWGAGRILCLPLKEAVVRCHCRCPSPLLCRSIRELNRAHSRILRNENLQSEFKSLCKAPILPAIPAAPLRGAVAAPSLNPRVKLRRLPDHCNVRPCESRLIQLIPSRRVNPDSVKPTRGSRSWLIPLLDTPQLSNLLLQKYRTILRPSEETRRRRGARSHTSPWTHTERGAKEMSSFLSP